MRYRKYTFIFIVIRLIDDLLLFHWQSSVAFGTNLYDIGSLNLKLITYLYNIHYVKKLI